MSVVEITKEEALAAVRAASWAKQIATCGHTGCEDHVGDGQRYIHVLSGFGMDMPLESVEQEIAEAQRVGWTRVHRYEVRRPAGLPDA